MIRTIVDVARRFPVIRFDAAMVLAKKHVRRLWFPGPGEGGGAIPSRAEFGTMSQADFDAAMPAEFWREVVDRVAVEAPDTLLLAEAFWLLEGYFVRTLGMHRVYNSAFMHMLRDEDNAGYRRVLKDTLEFDPEILKRYVNFMNNPDEKSAVEQFGKGDKYIGVATLLATLPGLPMFGHGQFEGFAEKYGMEFRRATMDEQPDAWLIERHEREIVPLLHRRGDFAEARDFLLYDVAGDGGGVDEHVFAYSNGSGPGRSLIVYHNRYAEAAGWIRDAAAFAVKGPDGSKSLVRRTLADGLGLADGPADGRWLAMREQRSGLEYLRSVAEIRERGIHVALRAYETRVFWELRELSDAAGVWARLAERLGGRGVPSLEGALRELQLAPVHDALRAAIAAPPVLAVERLVNVVADATGTSGDRPAVVAAILGLVSATEPVATTIDDASQAAALRAWALLRPLGSLASTAGVGATSRAWFEELRLAPAVADSLRGRGVDEAGAWGAAERVRLLLDLPLPSTVGGKADGLPLRLVDAWLADAGRALVPADQPLGRRGLVQSRVVARAARLDGSPGARPHAGGGAGQAAGRALGPDAPPGRGRRGVGLPGRCAARGARGGSGGDRRRAPADRPRACRRPPGSRPARRTSRGPAMTTRRRSDRRLRSPSSRSSWLPLRSTVAGVTPSRPKDGPPSG